jgi:hypothetical protein
VGVYGVAVGLVFFQSFLFRIPHEQAAFRRVLFFFSFFRAYLFVFVSLRKTTGARTTTTTRL